MPTRVPGLPWGRGDGSLTEDGVCSSAGHISVDRGAHSLQKGAQPGPSALPGSIPTPATQERHSFHRAMGSNTPPDPVSSLTCLSCRTDPGKEATRALFSAPNLDHGPHQGWDQVHRGPQRAPDFCSSPFHTWLPFFSFLQEAPPWSNFRD